MMRPAGVTRSRPEPALGFFLRCLLPVAEKEKNVRLTSKDKHSWKKLFKGRSLHVSPCFSACFLLCWSGHVLWESMCGCSFVAESKITAQGRGAKLLMEYNFPFFNPELIYICSWGNMCICFFFKMKVLGITHIMEDCCLCCFDHKVYILIWAGAVSNTIGLLLDLHLA